MEIKKLSKAARLLDQIKALDNEIIELDKIALIVVNDRTEINLNLSVKNLTKEDEDKIRVSFDTDGSLTSGGHSMDGLRYWLESMNPSRLPQPKVNKNYEMLNKIISPEDFLLVVQVLRASRMNERSLCFTKMAELGVKF